MDKIESPPLEETPYNSQDMIASNRTAAWNISGDHVITGTAKYVTEIRESLRWFYEMCRAENISMTKAAALIKISTSTLSKIYAGKYDEGNPLNVAQKIESYRKIWTERQGVISSGFIETTISQRVFTLCNLALKYNAMALIIGPSQVGKTTALLEYTRRYNHGRTKFVRIPASAGVQMVLREIAGACRISRESCFQKLRDRVLTALDENNLIILDEVHQAFSTYQLGSRMKVIEVLREIHDVTKCGMVLCATPIFEREMLEGKLKEFMEQINRRCIYRLKLKDAVKLPESDILALAAPFGLKAVDDQTLEIIRTTLQLSGVGMYVRFLQAGQELAKKKKQPMAWKYFLDAHDIIYKEWVK